MEDDVSTAGVGGETVQAVTGAMRSIGEWPMKLCSLTSCCATGFLTGCSPVQVRGLGGLGTPV